MCITLSGLHCYIRETMRTRLTTPSIVAEYNTNKNCRFVRLAFACVRARVCVVMWERKRFNSHKFLLFSLRFICTSATYTLCGISKTMQKWFLLFSLCQKEIEGITLNKLSPDTMILLQWVCVCACVWATSSRQPRNFPLLHRMKCFPPRLLFLPRRTIWVRLNRHHYLQYNLALCGIASTSWVCPKLLAIGKEWNRSFASI